MRARRKARRARAKREQVGWASHQEMLWLRLAPRLARAARPLARVVFVGDGAARHMCEELARAYGIENRVIFEGAVSGAENVASYYASFDVVVQPALASSCSSR